MSLLHNIMRQKLQTKPDGSGPDTFVEYNSHAKQLSMPPDAVDAASEAVATFLPLGLDTTTTKVPRWQEDLHRDVDYYGTVFGLGKPLWFSRADLTSNSPNIVTTNDLTTFSNSVGLAWWCRTLRRQCLRIVLSKLNLGYRTPLAEGSHGQANRGASLQTPTTAKINLSIRTSDKQSTVGLTESANEPEIKISLRSVSVYLITPHQKIQVNPLLHLSGGKGTSDFIDVSILISPLGRRELIERPNDKAEFAANGEEAHVYTYARERFEMGVDLASNPTNPAPQVSNRLRGRYGNELVHKITLMCHLSSGATFHKMQKKHTLSRQLIIQPIRIIWCFIASQPI
ncbi:hypothetical protein T265_00023 [Opisthorchis viverrini]|uniref:Uncharacterized protein n=1 Tax=Opisthorchis viverrini TaxID=6198 RepID=A0A075A3C3_OPIVI|nr:hypothetical protein T265_00023 [Opisthorchis viverrini]KER34153.1 hypothetical protein T265_00023 [Opisthorchis viverrini]